MDAHVTMDSVQKVFYEEGYRRSIAENGDRGHAEYPDRASEDALRLSRGEPRCDPCEHARRCRSFYVSHHGQTTTSRWNVSSISYFDVSYFGENAFSVGHSAHVPTKNF